MTTEMVLRRATREILRKDGKKHEYNPKLVYGHVEEWPDLQTDEVIPQMLHRPAMTGPWGSMRNLRPPEAYDEPFRDVIVEEAMLDPRIEEGIIEMIEGPEDPTDGAFDPGQPLPPQIPELLTNPCRRPALQIPQLTLDHLTDEEGRRIDEWFEAAATRGPVTYHDQIVEISHALRSLPRPAVLSRIGLIFGVGKGTIANHMKQKSWSPNLVGRPAILSSTQKALLVAFVAEEAAQRRPPTYEDLLAFIEENFGINMNLKTLHANISHLQSLQTSLGVPMEQERVDCDTEAIDAHYADLERILPGLPAEMVINLDEAGHQEWADRQIRKVIVPAGFPAQVEVAVSRRTKRATLLGAITLAGQYLKPLIIVPRTTTEAELYQIGYKWHAIYSHQECGFVTQYLFDYWADEVLFPYIETMRQKLQYDGSAVVLLDRCSCHESDHFLDACSFRGVIPQFLPPHTSDQTQPMDMLIFARQKQEAARTRPEDGLNAQTRQIVKMINGYEKACCANTITSAFRRAGIITQVGEGGYVIAMVNRECATGVRHWNLEKHRIHLVQHEPEEDGTEEEFLDIGEEPDMPGVD
jgi:hypothetical protein